MKTKNNFQSRLAFLLIASILSGSCFSQVIIDANTELVNSETSTQMRSRFSNTIAGRTTETKNAIRFDIYKLRDILNALESSGANYVQFEFATLRNEDTTRYFARNRGLQPFERNMVAGKPTLLIRVPSTIISTNSMERGSGATTSFIDIGVICPPPTSCD